MILNYQATHDTQHTQTQKSKHKEKPNTTEEHKHKHSKKQHKQKQLFCSSSVLSGVLPLLFCSLCCVASLVVLSVLLLCVFPCSPLLFFFCSPLLLFFCFLFSLSCCALLPMYFKSLLLWALSCSPLLVSTFFFLPQLCSETLDTTAGSPKAGGSDPPPRADLGPLPVNAGQLGPAQLHFFS